MTARLTVVALVAYALVAAAAMLVGVGDLTDAALSSVLLELRLARLVACTLIGAALATAGLLTQGLFRNPLADPGVLGTTSGAVLAGKTTLLLVESTVGLVGVAGLVPDMLVPLGSMVGAGLALVVLGVVTRRARSHLVLLLVGFTLASLFGSLGGLLTSLAQDRWELGRALVAYSLGSVSGTSARQLAFAAPLVLATLVASARHARALDLLLSGEDEAQTLGLDVPATRASISLWIAVATGAAVSLGGAVGFVGLVVPHALRGFVGAEHRRALPFCAAFGAVFVVGCDVLARALRTTSEFPLGVVTGIVGAPVFLGLLLRAHREGRLDG